jgi:peroxiredoxin
MPLLQRVADQYGARQVAVIGIGVDDADKIREFRGKLAIRFPLLVAGFDGMDLARQLGNPEPVLPYTALVSRSGRVVEQQSGRLKDSELRGWLVEHADD